jgi:hypothetical protein
VAGGEDPHPIHINMHIRTNTLPPPTPGISIHTQLKEASSFLGPGMATSEPKNAIKAKKSPEKFKRTRVHKITNVPFLWPLDLKI